VSDIGPQFTACFWEHLHHLLGTKLVRSSAYHPQIAGQTKHVNQILEDMLRAFVIGKNGYLLLSSPITIVIKRASRWLHLKLCMAISVGLL
jgi:hypothetical protein